MTSVMISLSNRPFARSMLRGLRGHCPECGKGRLFTRYLKVSPACESCGHDLDRYPADDGPAYFTILIVGHLVVAPMLLFSFIWKAPVWIVVPLVLISLLLLTLTILPRIKGGVVGLHHFLRLHRGDAAMHTADRL